ncbi:hypothetical protein, partial [Pseudoalteromonas sp. Z9A5]|uniref:hypothetical protein n=1 Tax=Pseudoalteromonas sp. Z9A5 TaxID=2686355 RepID=UPI001981A201
KKSSSIRALTDNYRKYFIELELVAIGALRVGVESRKNLFGITSYPQGNPFLITLVFNYSCF